MFKPCFTAARCGGSATIANGWRIAVAQIVVGAIILSWNFVFTLYGSKIRKTIRKGVRNTVRDLAKRGPSMSTRHLRASKILDDDLAGQALSARALKNRDIARGASSDGSILAMLGERVLFHDGFLAERGAHRKWCATNACHPRTSGAASVFCSHRRTFANFKLGNADPKLRPPPGSGFEVEPIFRTRGVLYGELVPLLVTTVEVSPGATGVGKIPVASSHATVGTGLARARADRVGHGGRPLPLPAPPRRSRRGPRRLARLDRARECARVSPGNSR